MSCLHTAIPTPSFCSFWHGHPYIPIHFLKMFFILVNIQERSPERYTMGIKLSGRVENKIMVGAVSS